MGFLPSDDLDRLIKIELLTILEIELSLKLKLKSLVVWYQSKSLDHCTVEMRGFHSYRECGSKKYS